MRTTLVLDDELVAEAKRCAADRRISLSAVVNDALMQFIKTKRGDDLVVPFRMPAFRPVGARPVDTTPAAFHEFIAGDETQTA